MTRVFVYGSLLRGEPNHGLLVAARFIGRAHTRPMFALHDLGAFPGVVSNGTTAIAGEIYEVDGLTLERLDRLEGHPHLYRREVVELVTDEGNELAYIYVYVASLGRARPISSGDWREHKEQLR